MKKALLLSGILCLSVFCTRNADSVVREPAVAGQFYPADSAALATMVKSHLENVKDMPAINGQLIALIVPHAGLVYSGQIAAYSYKLLENSPVNKVILCGPSHRFSFQGISVYGPSVGWKTPLGNIACDDALCNQFLACGEQIDVIKQAHAREHCLEVQLPYLQTVLDNFEIVPMVMGYPDHATTELMAKALMTLEIDTSLVIIASTDCQHHRPAAEGWRMDSLALDCVERLDPARLEKLLETGEVQLCGGGPTVAVLKAAIAKGADRARILRYGDSGDLTGDKSSVVGYAAVAIYRSAARSPGSETKDSKDAMNNDRPAKAFHLSDADRRKLLEIARQSIASHLADEATPEFQVSDNLRQPGAAFVTLERDGRLRGCIGQTVAREPLYRTVSYCAIQAAVADRRFHPVKPEELTKLEIEISVLTPLQEIESLDEIEVGRDGLTITLGNRRGLLLPQVATGYGWSRTEFLEHTCRKAGLPEDAYNSPNAVIYRFQAIVFGESDPH